MPKHVFVTRQIPKEGIDLLKKNKLKVTVSPHDRVLSKKEIIKMGKGCDALLSLLTDKIDGALLDGLGDQLKVVANYAVGYDNIDLAACKERKIKVSNTPGALCNSVSEHAMALMMACSKRVVEADKFMRAGKYKGWDPNLLTGAELSGKTLGIIGLGCIGKGLVKMAALGFGMKVLYFDINRDKDFEKTYKAKYKKTEDVLKESDFVSLHVPLLPQTKHLIGKKELRKMKKNAFLINTARGPVIDEAALYDALEKKEIAGAGLDVFECEPNLACNFLLRQKAKKLENLVVTPHIASATIEARREMALIAAKNVIAALAGKKMPTQVKL